MVECQAQLLGEGSLVQAKAMPILRIWRICGLLQTFLVAEKTHFCCIVSSFSTQQERGDGGEWISIGTVQTIG
jgi:hypothetical protein